MENSNIINKDQKDNIDVIETLNNMSASSVSLSDTIKIMHQIAISQQKILERLDNIEKQQADDKNNYKNINKIIYQILSGDLASDYCKLVKDFLNIAITPGKLGEVIKDAIKNKEDKKELPELTNEQIYEKLVLINNFYLDKALK